MTVALVGSSSFEPGSPLVAALQRELGVPVRAFGVRSSTVRDWNARELSGLDGAGRILVYLGANDGAVNAADVAELDARLAAFARVDWLALPRYIAPNMRRRADAFELAAERANVSLVRTRFQPVAEDFRDEVHFTTVGANKFAREVARALAARRWLPLVFGLASAAGLLWALTR